MTNAESFGSLLEVIRRTEAEVKRRLASERAAAEATLAEAERRARELLPAAETEGRREGEAQRQAALAEVERAVVSIVAQARVETEALQRRGEDHIEMAVARAIEIVIGVRP